MKFIQLIIMFLSVSTCYGQGEFQKSYFVSNAGERIDCYINKIKWSSPPNQIEYIVKENSTYHTISIDSIKEIKISDSAKFIRSEVDIDNSSTVSRLNSVSTQRKPEYERKSVFLEVLVEGYANLYVYKHKGFKLYFYSISGDYNIIPLVHKIYRISDGDITQMRSNNRFRQQLKTEFNCVNMRFDNLRYIKKDLQKVFKRYNQCKDEKG